MKIIQQNTFDKWDIEDNSIQAMITSPPYFQKRKYNIPDIVVGNWKGQHGLEPDYQLFIKHVMLWCQEAWRVLKDDGVMFLNYGDTYSQSGGSGVDENVKNHKQFGKITSAGSIQLSHRAKEFKPKCKMMIPERIAIALIDQGWILRSSIVWHKTNSLPESVPDRFSNKYENIFMFVKQQKYYFDLDAVRVSHSQSERNLKRLRRLQQGKKEKCKIEVKYNQQLGSLANIFQNRTEAFVNPKGANPGNVWNIPSQPSGHLHYAMYPEKLVERMVLCSTKSGDTVLDPFVGSGTTVKVAEALNREGVGIDLGYKKIQEDRLRDIQKSLPL